MGAEVGGGPAVDRGGVDPDGPDAALDEPGRAFLGEAREMEVGHGVLAARRGPQVALGVGPAVPPTRLQQHDRPSGDGAVRVLPRFQRSGSDLEIPIGRGGRRDVDHDGLSDQVLEWNIGRGARAFGEVDRRIEVGAAMLRGAEGLRRVPARGGSALAHHFQREGLRGRPVDRRIVEGVREVDDLGVRPQKGRLLLRHGGCREGGCQDHAERGALDSEP